MEEPGGASAARKNFSDNQRVVARWLVEVFEDPERHFTRGAVRRLILPKKIRRINSKSRGWDTDFTRLVQCGFDTINDMLEEQDVPCDVWAPLWAASVYGWPHIAELFLECGAKVDQRINTSTALHQTVLEVGKVHGTFPHIFENTDYLGVARVLLRYGADPTLVCEQRFSTPLDAARARGDCVEFVELFEADPRVQRRESRRTCSFCEGVASCAQPPFQVCAGCRCTRYCSRDCQKAAWRRGHRVYCHYLRGDDKGDSDDSADFEACLQAVRAAFAERGLAEELAASELRMPESMIDEFMSQSS